MKTQIPKEERHVATCVFVGDGKESEPRAGMGEREQVPGCTHTGPGQSRSPSRRAREAIAGIAGVVQRWRWYASFSRECGYFNASFAEKVRDAVIHGFNLLGEGLYPTNKKIYS